VGDRSSRPKCADARFLADVVREPIGFQLFHPQGPGLIMQMGLFDLASPALSWLDGLMSGWLPATARLVIWAVVAGALSMALYRLASNQARLAAIKAEAVALRKQMAAFDGPFGELWGLTRRNLGLALRQLWVTLVPAVLASVPVIFLLVWISNSFDAVLPASGEPVRIQASATEGQALPPLHWRGDASAQGDGAWTVAWPDASAPIQLLEADNELLLSLPLAAPVGVVHQRRWWNVLLANPAGYLPPGDVDTVEIDLPRQEYLPFGPAWLRGWMPLFFAVVIAVSLLLKVLWRLH
jgi:hypothetical protein